jgi:predicted CopG family antitoxin
MKTIKVSDEVHRRLSDLGKKGDTFADVVEMLLLDYEARQKSGAKK